MRTSIFPGSRGVRREGALVAACAAFLSVPLWASPASAQPLVYYGGGVISNVEVVQVAWTSDVQSAYQADLTKFYQAVLGSTYLDWLSEYDTLGKVGFGDGLPGSEQHIGRGSFLGAFVIAPGNASTSLDAAAIGQELVEQIGKGALPKPELDLEGHVRSLYMIDFPSGYGFTLGAQVGCADFDGYHFTVHVDGAAVPFSVHPDCGQSFGRQTVVHTHELVEAITDPEVDGASVARPTAWRATYESGWDEIADLCQGSGVGLVGGYKVAKNWSNFAGGCVVEIPVCDGQLAPPACRPCSALDAGSACSGVAPLCAEDGPKKGQCIACTAADATACSGATPLCDTDASTCVGCLADADCKDSAAPVCDAKTQACRACSANSECQSGVCDAADDSQSGQCVECMADADCDAGEVCDQHACAPPPVPTDTGGDTGKDSGGGCSVAGAPRETSADGAWLFALLAAAWGRLRRRRAPRS